MKTPKPKRIPKKAKRSPASSQNLGAFLRGEQPERTPEEKLFHAFMDTDEMAEFLDARSAVMAALKEGKNEVTLPTVFCDAVVLSMDPEQFPRWQAAWNRVCDELGMPEHKKPDRAPTAADMTTGKKISVMKTLRYETRKGTEGAGEGGPF